LTCSFAGRSWAQDEPEYWDHFCVLRQELEASREETLRRWGDRADARLAWLHGYVTAARDDAEYDKWFDRAAEILRLVRGAMSAREGTDFGLATSQALHLVARVRERGSHDAAAEIVGDLVAWLPDDRAERLDCLLLLAECRRRAYRWEAASKALDLAEQAVRDDEGRVRVCVQRAALLLARGLPDLAAAEVDAAERSAAGPWLESEAMFVRLRLEHAFRRPDQAVARLHAFLSRPVPPSVQRDPAWLGRLTQLRIRAALAVLADPHRRSPHDAEAESWLREAIEDATTSSDERLLARMVLVTHWLDTARLDDVPAQMSAASMDLAAQALGDLDERRLAFVTLSVRHARIAGVERAARRVLANDLGRVWQMLVRRWQDQPISRTGAGPLFFGDCRRALVEWLLATFDDADEDGAAEAVMTEILQATVAGSLGRLLGASAPGLDEVRAFLCAEENGVLVFVPGHEVTLALAMDRATTSMHVLAGGAHAIDEARRALLRNVELFRQHEANDLGVAVDLCSSLLLTPAVSARIARWRRVAIVGLDSLGYLPFELLTVHGGVRLGESHAVSYLPSLSVGVWLAKNRPASPLQRLPRIRVLACPDVDVAHGGYERLDRLEFRDDDLQPWRDACGGVLLEILRGERADARAGFDAAACADFVQVLAHGIRDEARAEPQGVLLGDGGVVWASDIEALDSARYVFLGVCRAGRGRLRRGDDGRHLLSGAALSAGARGVVLPVLDVGYRETLAFSADVHRALWQGGDRLDDALRHARRAASTRAGGRELDAFLFHLVGLGDEALLPAGVAQGSRGRWSVSSLATIAVLGVLGLWCGRRRLKRRTAPS
jgi:hypothetical protein